MDVCAGTKPSAAAETPESIGPIDCFIQDSVGTPPTVLAELDVAWNALRPNGWLVVNAINRSEAFQRFAERHAPASYIVAPSGGGAGGENATGKVPGQFALVMKQLLKQV